MTEKLFATRSTANFIFSVALVISGMCLALLNAEYTFAGSGQRQRTTTGSKVVSANDFPGQDIGAKINAADKALGTAKGEIVIKGGGTITTQVIISSDHVLRLMPGTYAARTTGVPILLKPRSSLVGSGWDSIILESTAPGQFTVISAYNNSIENGTADSGLTIRDVQIKGANAGFNSAP